MLLVVAALGSAVLAGCSSGSGAEPATPSSTASSTASGSPAPSPGSDPGLAEPSEPSDEVLAAVAALPGRLAIGSGDSLAVSRPDGSGRSWLDQDADVVAAQPTWAPDGRHLAWTRTTAVGPAVVVRNLDTAQEVESDLTSSAPFYLQWSFDGQALAYLRNDPNQGGAELGVLSPGTPPERMGSASPLFVAWAPDGGALAAHVSATQLLVVPSPTAPAAALPRIPAAILSPTGIFSTPAWVDNDRVLAAGPSGLVLVEVATNEVQPIVDTGGAPVEFVLSPDRSQVAFVLPGQAGAVSPASLSVGGAVAQGGVDAAGGLQVLDLVTGRLATVSGSGALAFEWSRDSSHLAWLEQGASALRPWWRWNIWNGQASTPSVAFEPSATVERVYLPFFEQYAQSMTGWSPDGAAFAFAGRPAGTEADDGVWVQLVGAPGVVPPVRVADGDVVAWSP